MLDRCISFFKIRNENRCYKAYITDVLKAIAETNGVSVSMRFAERYEKKTQQKELSAKDVKAKILAKINKKGVE